jgi:hypothetical protein
MLNIFNFPLLCSEANTDRAPTKCNIQYAKIPVPGSGIYEKRTTHHYCFAKQPGRI